MDNTIENQGNDLDVQFSRKALKFLHATDRITKRRIQESVNGLLEVPLKGDIKAMQGQPPGTFRLRVGKYRIVYEIASDILRILNIGSYGTVIWSDDVDIAPEHLYECSIPVDRNRIA